MMKKYLGIFVGVMLIMCMMGCGSSLDNKMSRTQDVENTDESENKTMRLFIDDKEVPVIWEDTLAVKELQEETNKGDIVVDMSMYSDNEQVGALGKNYSGNNKQTTTHNGDIVLYNNSNIVVFYGSNSWSYTRLGKMDLSESEVVNLLSKGDVTLSLRK